MSADPADDAAVRTVIERTQREIEAAAQEASRLEAKWDGYCGLVQACDEDENWGQVLRDQQQQKEGEDDIDFSPGAIAALRARLEALRCSAVAAAVAPARAVGRKNGDEEEEDKEARVASSDAAYAAAIDRVKAGDMPGAAAKLRDALFVEGRPRARERIEKYLRACEARIFLKKG